MLRVGLNRSQIARGCGLVIVVDSNIDAPVAKLGLDDTIEHLVDDILLGKYGNGEDRKNAIYEAVQELVNYKLGVK